MAYIQAYVPEAGVALLAGNSVGMDKAFLRRGPYGRVLEHLHYRILDVSSLMEAARRWCRPPVLDEAPKKRHTHRAKDDILESIAQAAYYRDVIFRPARETTLR